MLRSMYSGISGMKVNQTKLDVIGNNISNVGTTSFKASRAKFQDMLYQSVKDSMAPSMNQGGVNAKQVGLGVQLSSIDRVMTQGMMQPTGRALDVAVDGDGFFMVSKGPSVFGDNTLEVSHRAGAHNITEQSLSNSGSQIMYSRDGAFTLDESGNLLTSDGYRVLGYALTNDDNAIQATSQSSNNVSVSTLDFRFGPGSQLNGYKVTLGQVGSGTVSSANVDKENKLVVIDGDFSSTSTLTKEQLESAINKGLSTAGISQRIEVAGQVPTFTGIGTGAVTGGANATAPNSISLLGVTYKFTEGSGLNGYTFKVGNVSSDTVGVEVKSATKEIVLSANFVDSGAVTADALKDAINNELSAKGFTQSISSVTGSVSRLSQLTGSTDTTGSNGKVPSNISVGGFGVTFSGLNDDLNNYTFTMNNDTSKTTPEVKVDKTNKSIIIAGNLSTITQADIKTLVNQALDKNSIKEPLIDTVTGAYDGTATKTTTIVGGEDLKSPKGIEVAGITVTLPKGAAYNDYTIEIADVNNPSFSVTHDAANKKLIVSGDFLNPNAVTSSMLTNEINTAIGAAPDNKATVSGVVKVVTGLSSNLIDGGEELKAPTATSAFGMDFQFTPGGDLNGYKIQIGKITSGTATSVNIDQTSKTISINGDFTNPGAVAGNTIQNLLNQAMQDKGINQGIRVIGEPQAIAGVLSEETNGGTPVQSLNTDGSVAFVDGTKQLKAYDGSLKSLKIPDKVVVPGTGQELKVKSYTIDKTGVLNAILEDGSVAALGQIAMASFKNPEGLASLGKNLYSGSANSGEAVIKSGLGTTGEDNSKGYGDNVQGMLEMSNVDLAEQFTDMIVTNRAFQASGKMITTGDEILQDIINLKR